MDHRPVEGAAFDKGRSGDTPRQILGCAMRVSVVIVRSIMAELRKYGVDVAAVLSASEIEADKLADLRASLAVASWDRLLRSALALTGDPVLGVSIGLTQEGALQLLSHLLFSSRSVLEAWALAHRYSALIIDGFESNVVHSGGQSRLQFSFHPCVVGDNLRFAEELVASLAYRLSRHVAADCPPEIRFSFPEPQYVARYQALEGCRIHFSCPCSEIVFRRDQVVAGRPHGDAKALEALRHIADTVIAKSVPPTLAERVRSILRYQYVPEVVDVDELARKVGLSARSLRYRLRAEGTNLDCLLEERRRAIACDKLLQPSANIKEIAACLGFSERSAFHRAFKRWTGQTPRAFIRSREKLCVSHTER